MDWCGAPPTALPGKSLENMGGGLRGSRGLGGARAAGASGRGRGGSRRRRVEAGRRAATGLLDALGGRPEVVSGLVWRWPLEERGCTLGECKAS